MYLSFFFLHQKIKKYSKRKERGKYSLDFTEQLSNQPKFIYILMEESGDTPPVGMFNVVGTPPLLLHLNFIFIFPIHLFLSLLH